MLQPPMSISPCSKVTTLSPAPKPPQAPSFKRISLDIACSFASKARAPPKAAASKPGRRQATAPRPHGIHGRPAATGVLGASWSVRKWTRHHPDTKWDRSPKRAKPGRTEIGTSKFGRSRAVTLLGKIGGYPHHSPQWGVVVTSPVPTKHRWS